MFGLSSEELKYICEYFTKIIEIEEVIMFGSRAMGNYKKGSDIDIAIRGNDITYRIINKINYDLNEESLLIYFFDIVNYDSIKNINLLNHINKEGKTIYKKNQ